MKLVKISFEDVKPFASAAKKERVSFENPYGARWYGLITENGDLVSFYCLVAREKTARFKSNYTIPEFRRKGCLQIFILHAKELCKAHGIREMTAFCTPLSVKSHIRNGAVVQSQNKDIAFVKYKL